MQLKNWIIHKRPNQIALLLVSPLILSLCLLLIIGSNNLNVLLSFLYGTVLIQFCVYLLYTQSLGILLIEANTEQQIVTQKKLNTLGALSVLLMIIAGVSIVSEMPLAFVLLLLAGIIELIRFHYLSKLLIHSERQAYNIWTYLATLWIFLNPLVGIWPLHKRVYNVLGID